MQWKKSKGTKSYYENGKQFTILEELQFNELGPI